MTKKKAKKANCKVGSKVCSKQELQEAMLMMEEGETFGDQMKEEGNVGIYN